MATDLSILAWSVGPWEWAAVLVLALLLFGGKKLPELARGMGKGIREFKRGVKGIEDDLQADVEDEPVTKLDNESSKANRPDGGDDAS